MTPYMAKCVTLALILCALLLVSCFSLAAGIKMLQSASRMLPSYGVELGKPTIVPLAWKRTKKHKFEILIHHKAKQAH